MALKARLAPSRSPLSWAACADSSSVSAGSARSCSALRAWLLRLDAVAGGDRGQALRQLAIAAPAPALAPAFEQRARRADDPAVEQPQRRRRPGSATTTATISTPTLVSSRQPRHSAVTVPGRSASHTAPSIATAATTNQISVRSDGHRITAPRPAGRRPAPRAGRRRVGRRDAPRRAASQSAVALVGLRRQRLHQLDRLGEVAGLRAPLRRAPAWPRPNRPGTSAPTRRSETRPLSLPSSRSPEGIVGQVVGQRRLGHRRERGGEARRARRRPSGA